MPIIESLLDVDFYKFTMGQLIWRLYRDVQVTFSMKLRTAKVRLADVINMEELKAEFDHVLTLRFTKSELHYLRGTNEYSERMFKEPYLEALNTLQLTPYVLRVADGNFELEFTGPWSVVVYWETIALAIVNELYYRSLMKGLTRFEREVILSTGRLRLAEKIRIIRTRPDLVFSDFGTRRRFSRDWQFYVDEVLAQELPGQFLGTSNTYAAMKHSLLPMGTSAHELPMVIAGINGGAEKLATSQQQVLRDWWEEYGWGLSIFLPDTFGTPFFFRQVTPEQLSDWKGFRWDSGDAFAFGDNVIALYESVGVNPREKLLVPSDGLELPMMLRLQDYFAGRIKLSHGWGTGLTNDLLDNTWYNDLWFGPLSLVVKAVRANGAGLVKLSDNLAKATGRPEDITAYKAACGYTNTASEICRY